jgi:AraC family transcriptional regulator
MGRSTTGCLRSEMDGTCGTSSAPPGQEIGRSTNGSVLLAPGCVLLSNAGSEFECRHEHSKGDRCIPFHFEPALFREIAEELQIEWSAFGTHRIPPLCPLVPLIAEIELAAARPVPLHMEELAMRVASCALVLSTGEVPSEITPSWHDEARATLVIRYMEQHFDEQLTLQRLSLLAGLSQFHSLRIFRKALGVTPYQYLMRIRLGEAARQLRCSDKHVTDIATGCGFGDLSEFSRYF